MEVDLGFMLPLSATELRRCIHRPFFLGIVERRRVGMHTVVGE